MSESDRPLILQSTFTQPGSVVLGPCSTSSNWWKSSWCRHRTLRDCRTFLRAASSWPETSPCDSARHCSSPGNTTRKECVRRRSFFKESKQGAGVEWGRMLLTLNWSESTGFLKYSESSSSRMDSSSLWQWWAHSRPRPPIVFRFPPVNGASMFVARRIVGLAGRVDWSCPENGPFREGTRKWQGERKCWQESWVWMKWTSAHILPDRSCLVRCWSAAASHISGCGGQSIHVALVVARRPVALSWPGSHFSFLLPANTVKSKKFVHVPKRSSSNNTPPTPPKAQHVFVVQSCWLWWNSNNCCRSIVVLSQFQGPLYGWPTKFHDFSMIFPGFQSFFQVFFVFFVSFAYPFSKTNKVK